jgi:hypothetical protein
MAESYLQHAEHYFRLIAAAQQAQQQSAYGYQRTAAEQLEADDDGDDDDFASLPDRFASPAERIAPPQPAPQPFIERPSYNGGGERQPYEPRQERYGQERHQAQDRAPRQERGYQDQQGQPDRPERYDNRPERYDNRPDRNAPRAERQPYVERVFPERAPAERAAAPQDRGGQDRGNQDRGNQERSPGNGQARDYDNRGHRNGNRGLRAEAAPREPRENAPREVAREPRQPDIEPSVAALPAFITTPARIQPDVAPVPDAVVASANEARPAPVEAASEDVGFAIRPRRRRRAKAEFPGIESDAPQPTPDPVGD